MTGTDLVVIEPAAVRQWPGLDPAVARYVRNWLAVDAAGSEHTYDTYVTAIGMWLEYCAARGLNPVQVGRDDVDIWHRWLAQTPSPRTGRPPAKRTLATRVSVVASFYRYLEESDVIDKVPVRRRTRPTAPKDSPTTGLSTGEQNAVVDRLAREPALLDRAVVLTLMLQGLRISELLRMTVGDGLTWKDGHPAMRVHGKGGRIRTIVVDPAVRRVLEELAADRYGPEPHPDARLFVRVNGAPLSRRTVDRTLKRIVRAAGIPSWKQIHPHSMRHTCITELLSAGNPLGDVQDFAGHATPETTRRYDRAAGAMDRSARAVARRRQRLDEARTT